ncbi:MAG TPA: GNAT family N-acetyltransferase [Fimbriimonas sp.]|nr:GNAT family N-acetyltransferase [Fimbriimonas sp.]
MASFRPATAGDLPRIVSLVEVCLAEFGLFVDYETADADLRDFSTVYAEPNGVFFVEIERETIVGTGGLATVGPSEGKIRKMYVARSHRGHGVGKRILRALIDEAKGRRMESVVLETMDSMETAIRMYESAGFVRQEECAVSPRCQRVYRLCLNG